MSDHHRPAEECEALRIAFALNIRHSNSSLLGCLGRLRRSALGIQLHSSGRKKRSNCRRCCLCCGLGSFGLQFLLGRLARILGQELGCARPAIFVFIPAIIIVVSTLQQSSSGPTGNPESNRNTSCRRWALRFDVVFCSPVLAATCLRYYSSDRRSILFGEPELHRRSLEYGRGTSAIPQFVRKSKCQGRAFLSPAKETCLRCFSCHSCFLVQSPHAGRTRDSEPSSRSTQKSRFCRGERALRMQPHPQQALGVPGRS